jgi:hypothetical protein
VGERKIKFCTCVATRGEKSIKVCIGRRLQYRGRSIDQITFFRNSFLCFEFRSFEKSVDLLFFLRITFFPKLGQGRSG